MIDLDRLPIGNHRVTCWNCGRGPRDKTMGVTVKPDRWLSHCYRCGTTWSSRRKAPAGARTSPAPEASKRTTLSDYGRDLWNEYSPIRGDGLANLRARNCVIPPADGDLRYHPELRHPSGYVGPALVALITDAKTGVPLSLHRTWIRANGEKANVDPPRLLLKGHSKKNGVIRLWPDDSVTTGLAVAEGIETALSVAHAFTPVWSCIDAGNLADFPVLSGIESLTIAGDDDPAGRAAAARCAERWGAHAEIRLILPPAGDFNDLAVSE